MSTAREMTTLWLDRGRASEVLSRFEEYDKVELSTVTMQALISTRYSKRTQVGPLRISYKHMGRIPSQTLYREQISNLMNRWDEYADEIFSLTGEHLLSDERLYILKIDLVDRDTLNTARFRLLSKDEIEHTEAYVKVIKGIRPNFQISLELDKQLRRQIWSERRQRYEQRAKPHLLFKLTDMNPIQLRARLPNVYEIANKRTCLIEEQAYMKLVELSCRIPSR